MDTLHVVTQMIWATLGAWRSEAWVRYVQSEVNQGVLASDDVLLVGQERPRDHGEVLEAELQPRPPWLPGPSPVSSSENIQVFTKLTMVGGER